MRPNAKPRPAITNQGVNVRVAILSIACVAGLSCSANQASAGTFSFSWYRPAPVVVNPYPTYYYPPVVTPYYPSYPSYVPLYVSPAPVITYSSWGYRTYPTPAYYPSSGIRFATHYRR